MTYAEDLARANGITYYVKLHGMETRFSGVDPDNWPEWNPSGTFIAALDVRSLNGGKSALDRGHGFVDDGAISFNLLDLAGVDEALAILGGDDFELAFAIDADSAILEVTSDATPPTTGFPYYLYLDRETVEVTAENAPEFDITRAALDSESAPHQAGAKLSTRPIHLDSRRLTIYAVYLDTGNEYPIFSGTIAGSPKFDNGLWAFSSVGMIHDYMKRPLHSGWQEIEAISATISAEGNLVFEVVDARHFATPGHIRVTSNGKAAIYGGVAAAIVLDTASSPNTVTIVPGYRRIGQLEPLEAVDGQPSLMQVDIVHGEPWECALQAITSDYGDGANSSLAAGVAGNMDVLAGRPVSVTGGAIDFTAKRMGAGVPHTLVNPTSFKYGMNGGRLCTIWIDEPQELGAWLANEVLFRAGGFIACDGDGVLTFHRYQADSIRSALPAYDLADLLVSNVASIYDEGASLDRVEVRCNYDPLERRFRQNAEINFLDRSAVYSQRGASAAYASKGTWLGSAPGDALLPLHPTSEIEIEADMDRRRARYIVAGRRTSLRMPFDKHVDFVPGFRFRLTDSRPPNHDGTKGYEDRAFEVVGRTPDWANGYITIDVEELPTGVLLCPSFIVDSYDAGTQRITIRTTGPFGDGFLFEGDPTDHLGRNGWWLRWYRAAVNYTTSEAGRIATNGIISATVVELDLAPTTAPAVGDLLVLEISGDTGATNALGADVEDYAFAADSGYLIDSGGDERAGPRWS